MLSRTIVTIATLNHPRRMRSSGAVLELKPSPIHHLPFKERPRSIARRQERRFKQHLKAEFTLN